MTQESPISKPPIPKPPVLPYFSEEGLSEQLKHRSARSGAVMLASYAVQLLIGIGGTAVLARLLTPADFGYLAMVATLLGFITALREFLLTPAVHRQELSHEQASGLFWINCVASAIVAAAAAAMAPVLVWFFDQPLLMGMGLAMSVGVLIHMLAMVHLGLLRRQMRFGAISLLEIGAAAAGVVVGIISALMGAQYWALVFQQVTVWVVQSAAASLLCGWRPAAFGASAFRRDEGIRSMLRYGQAATASRVCNYLSRNIDTILVGRVLDATILGYYQKAYQWAMTPFWQIFFPVTPVAVSALSRLQDDPPRYRIYARTLLLAIFGLTFPGTLLLMIEADNVILLLMGNQWLSAIPLLRVLSVGAWFAAIGGILGWFFLSEGRARDQLTWSLCSAPVMVLGVVIGLQWGIIGVAVGYSAAMFLLAGPGVWFCLRRSPLSVGDFLGAAARPVAAALLAGVGLLLVRSTLRADWHFVVQLIVHSCIFGMLYVIGWLALPGGVATWREFLRHFREIRRGSDV